MRAPPPALLEVIRKIRSRGKTIAAVALGWLAVSCLGYGLALRDYADGESSGFRTHDFGGSYQTYEGKITSVSEGLLWSEPSFRLARLDRTFILPLEMISSPEPLEAFRDHVTKGVFVRVHARSRDDVVVGLWTKWNTPDSTELVQGQDLPKRVLLVRARGLRERGNLMVILGLALAPAGLLGFHGARFLARKLRRSSR